MIKKQYRKKNQGKAKLLKNISIIVYLLLLFIPFLLQLKNEAIRDEGWWISSGKEYLNLYMKADFDNPVWFNYYFKDWSWMNPQLGKYIIGLPYYFTNYREKKLYYPYDPSKDRWDIDQNNKDDLPEEDVLLIGRLPCMILG